MVTTCADDDGDDDDDDELRGMRGSNSSICWRMLSLGEMISSLEGGFLPYTSLEDLAFTLDKCTKEKDRASALRVLECLHKWGLEAHTSLGNHLVSMLVNVGCMCDAHQVFDKLVCRHASSCNSLIIGYVNCGKSEHALAIYHRVYKEDSLFLSGHAFVALLKACSKLHDLQTGLKLHTHIASSGLLESDLFVGITLVDMYAKCGLLEKAQQIFIRLPRRSVVVWTALIAGYAEHGDGEEALQCFEQMQLERIAPNAITFVCSLKACSSIRAIQKGLEIHAEVARQGLPVINSHVGGALVNMYAKFSLLAKAQEVFHMLPVRSVVSWNSIIMGYAEHGNCEEALKMYDQMQSEGNSPNMVTYVCILMICGSIRAIDRAREIHVEMERQGLLDRDLVVGNALVDMYIKCGLLGLAQQVFNKLPARDVVSWTTLIAGYAEYEHNNEALKCLEEMQREGLVPDAVAYICGLKACGSIKDMGKGRNLHIDIERKGLLNREPSVGNSVVEMYSKCGCFALAWEVFDNLPVRDDSSWSALVAGYAEHGLDKEVVKCFEQMQLQGISPNAITYVCTLKACSSLSDLDKGQEIHTQIERQGLFETNLFVGSILVDMYAKCGLLAKAQRVFDKLPVRNAVSWTSLIAGYAEDGQGEEALKWFGQMQRDGILPDAATFVCILKACSSIGATDKGEDMHAEIERRGLMENGLVGNTLVDMYVKCGCLDKAQEVFDKLPTKDVVSWTALMVGYTQLGQSEDVFLNFDRMIGNGVKPNLITFVVVLNACSRRGFFDKSQTYYSAMSSEYGIAPTLEHHSCMVDLFGRAGQLDKALAIIKKMPLDPNFVTWHSVLGACTKWGNSKAGKQAFEQVVHLDEKDCGAYVLMSHLYTESNVELRTMNG